MAEDKVEEEIGKFAAARRYLKQLDTIRQKADEMGPEEVILSICNRAAPILSGIKLAIHTVAAAGCCLNY